MMPPSLLSEDGKWNLPRVWVVAEYHSDMWSQQTGTHTIHNLDELRALIEEYDAWGISLQAFERRAGYRQEGNSEYITHFSWGGGSGSLHEM